MNFAESFPISLSSARVLVVDDEPGILVLVQMFLEKEVRQIVTAVDGCEGLRKFQEETFDLVITDRSMPGLGGEAMAREIRRLSPHVPIILMTGFLNPMIDATPFRGFLAKPFTGPQLLAAVAESLTDPDAP
jgi:CheY-like chemotaxis protein